MVIYMAKLFVEFVIVTAFVATLAFLLYLSNKEE